ncbi:MarR family transcriptional regulator [Nocardioides panacisoli]|uniref:MarR family winged helix-turn-helix transcriptional regulator n=1 Tax=Nocardioides panacisoli TaxID=627624 RepID=UPI001C630D0F|nr:MarR family transcriptional regulator [Nocardioides panacisoli]QYJ03224.1 MarR family transcriptional regulator [Nocardioides panacisoli]
MTSGADDVRWLSADERAAWQALTALAIKLPAALDAQLQDDEGLSFFEYMIMAMLSEQEDRTLQMSELAAATSASLSRLSHAAKRLESQGFLRRERLPGPGRRTRAELTDAGHDKIVAAAPGHVRRVRELVIDGASRAQLRALREVAEDVMPRIDPTRACD